MILCDRCVRSNPPTRVSCLYCGATLPVTEVTAKLRQPVFIPPDKFQSGFNSITIPNQTAIGDTEFEKAADFLKISPACLQKLLAANIPLPFAHTASEEEANLVSERMSELGIKARTLSDNQLGVSDDYVVRIRSVEFHETSVAFRLHGPGNDKNIAYGNLLLIVLGRLVTQKTEVKELKSRLSENEIVDASQFFADEPVVDIYSSCDSETLRITANNFDFSCLQDQKTLVAAQNLSTLVRVIASKAPRTEIDDSYSSLRQTLEPIWGTEKETESRGWRRDAPGRITIGATTTHSNESQFTRYSRLRYFLRIEQGV